MGARRCSIDENSAAMAQMAPDEHKPPHPLLTSLPAARPGHENCMQNDEKALLLADTAKCMQAMRCRRDDRGPLGTHVDEIEPAYVAAAFIKRFARLALSAPPSGIYTPPLPRPAPPPRLAYGTPPAHFTHSQ